MLKANEIRLGNWIKVIKILPIDSDKEYLMVTARFFSSLAAGRAHDELVNSIDEEINVCYTGIEITPEIFSKLDLVKNAPQFEELELAVENSFLFLQEGDIIFEKDNRYVNVKCHYLHQLQNIYYFLYGKELDVSSLNLVTDDKN